MRRFALLVILSACLRAADPAVAVIQASKGWRQAAIQRDAAGLQRYLADDMVYNHSNGHGQNKSEYIAAVLKSGHYESFTDSDTKVRVFGTTAILSGFVDVKQTGQPAYRVHTLEVYVQNKGQWQMTAHQSVRINPPAAQGESRPNTLTPDEQKQGFVLLFDGNSLDRWDAGDQKVWTVVDGAIRSNARQGAGRILTKEEFTNFILKAEFRADPEIHSHILLRQPRPGAKGGAGYELQIRDKDPSPRPDGSFLTASLVNVGRAPADARILPGRWNSVEITMDSAHMTVIYNGRKVVDGQDSRRASGCIALDLATPNEAPDANIQFRNLKIKRLP
jgi:ketosteroid isomerase-like protein